MTPKLGDGVLTTGPPGSLWILFFFFFLIFVAVLGLHCCTGFSLVLQSRRPHSGCGAQASCCRGFSCCSAQALGHSGFSGCSAWTRQLQFPGSKAQAQ